MLVDHSHGVLQKLRRTVAVLLQLELRLVVTKLAEQALAQIAAANARGIQLTNNLQRFLQIGGGEFRLIHRSRLRRARGRGRRCGGRISRSR